VLIERVCFIHHVADRSTDVSVAAPSRTNFASGNGTHTCHTNRMSQLRQFMEFSLIRGRRRPRLNLSVFF
jgi:hypothetical protein